MTKAKSLSISATVNKPQTELRPTNNQPSSTAIAKHAASTVDDAKAIHFNPYHNRRFF